MAVLIRISLMLAIFHMLVDHLFDLGEMSIEVLCPSPLPIFNWVACPFWS